MKIGLDLGFAGMGGGRYYGSSFYLDLLSGTSLDSRVTFTRGTNATLTDSAGRITYAPANLLLRSQEFDDAVWTKTAATITANTSIAPDGTTTADTVNEGTTLSVHSVSQAFSSVSGTANTLSVYLKNVDGRYAQLLYGSAGHGSTAFANFDLQTGTVGTVGATATASITNAGNGWYRCTITSTATATTASASGQIVQITSATSARAENYTGTSKTILLWGAQLEPVTYQTTPGTYVATTSAAYYGPRFDFDPVTLAPRGLLIEEQRSNLLTYSAEFDNAAWVKTDSTVTANATSSPDGTVGADLVTEGSAGTAQIGQTATITAGVAITASVYLKRGNTDWMRIQIVNGVDFFRLWVNTATGAIGTTGAGGAGVYTSSSIRSAANGWYRVSITGTLPASPANVFLNTASADNSSTRVSGGTYFAWGAQLEVGAFATSYIPTVASTVTRNADVATMTGTNFSSWYNQSAGTFVVDADCPAVGTHAVFAADDGTVSNTVRIRSSAADPFYSVRVGGVDQANIDAGTITANTAYRQSGAYAANDFATSLNGATVLTDTSGSLPTVTRLALGADANANYLNGHIRAIAYFNSRLPNAQLQSLTAPTLALPLSLDFTTASYTVG
jgi:hypothetical protein